MRCENFYKSRILLRKIPGRSGRWRNQSREFVRVDCRLGGNRHDKKLDADFVELGLEIQYRRKRIVGALAPIRTIRKMAQFFVEKQPAIPSRHGHGFLRSGNRSIQGLSERFLLFGSGGLRRMQILPPEQSNPDENG